MHRRVIPLLVFFILFPCLISPHANSEPTSATVTIVSVPGLSFDHLYETPHPHFRRLLEEGNLGAMNLRTAGADTLANSYATLGAGRRVSLPQKESFYHSDEWVSDRPASAWVKERFGFAPGVGVIYPALVPFIDTNRAGDKDIQQIMLGASLRRAGFRTAVWGNVDQGQERERYAPFLTMDERGQTGEAAIGGEHILIKDPDRPYGIKTDYKKIEQQLRISKAHLRVVELGDLYRLQQEKAMMTDEQAKTMERQIMQEIDRFLGKVLAHSSEGALWLISPSVQVEGVSRFKAQLAPTIRLKAEESAGLLYSPTTRRTGIIANVDLAPTILQTFGLTPPAGMEGQPVVATAGDTGPFWTTLEQVVTVNRLRPFVIYAYAMYQVTVLIVALGLLLSKRKRCTKKLQMALLASVLTPVLFLLLAGVPAMSKGGFFVFLITAAFLAAYFLQKLPTVPLFLALGMIGFLPIIIDGLLGSRLIRQSFLGYDPIIGARYYGIGNEYMGVVLGSVILMVAAALEWKQPVRRWVKSGIALLFVLLVLYFAAPFWGTNAGGALAASVGFGVAYARFFHAHWGLRFWLTFVALGVTGIGLLVAMNVLFSVDAPSHIGRAFDHLMAGNLAEIASIAKRKLATNIRLIKASLWGRVFFISLLAMTVLIIQPLRGVRWLQMRYPYIFQGFTAILIAALSALAFNDSGIVSAATAIVYVVIPLLIIVGRDWTP